MPRRIGGRKKRTGTRDMKVNLKKLGKLAHRHDYVLLMMRHAKATSIGPDGDAHRELTDKGERQAKAVSRALASMDLIPERIACSSAVRSVQTLERMLKTFGDTPKVDYRQNLYDHGAAAVFAELRETKGKVRVLMVLGHEPTVSMACQRMANQDDPQYDELNLGLSPASVVILGSQQPFDQWREHSAQLIDIFGPEQL